MAGRGSTCEEKLAPWVMACCGLVHYQKKKRKACMLGRILWDHSPYVKPVYSLSAQEHLKPTIGIHALTCQLSLVVQTIGGVDNLESAN